MDAGDASGDESSGAGRRRPGELETQVLTVLAAAATSLTPREVLDRLDPDGTMSYSTVVTVLGRLYEKGAATRYKDGRAFRYGAVGSAAGLVGYRMGRLLEGESDRTAVLQRFISTLTDQDERTLRALLRDDPDG